MIKTENYKVLLIQEETSIFLTNVRHKNALYVRYFNQILYKEKSDEHCLIETLNPCNLYSMIMTFTVCIIFRGKTSHFLWGKCLPVLGIKFEQKQKHCYIQSDQTFTYLQNQLENDDNDKTKKFTENKRICKTKIQIS